MLSSLSHAYARKPRGIFSFNASQGALLAFHCRRIYHRLARPTSAHFCASAQFRYKSNLCRASCRCLFKKPQPLIAVSFPVFGSTSSALPIQRTLLHRIRTWPRVPELTPLTNSSVLESWMFMYRSTETSLPLYSVSPHFNRTTMSLSTLWFVSRSADRRTVDLKRKTRRTSSGGEVGG